MVEGELPTKIEKGIYRKGITWWEVDSCLTCNLALLSSLRWAKATYNGLLPTILPFISVTCKIGKTTRAISGIHFYDLLRQEIQSSHVMQSPRNTQLHTKCTKKNANSQIWDNMTRHKGKVSFIIIEKSPFSRWRRNSKVNTSSGSHRKSQTRGDKKQTKNEKHTLVWTKVPVSHLFRDHQQ
jgi:hypothetical protein